MLTPIHLSTAIPFTVGFAILSLLLKILKLGDMSGPRRTLLIAIGIGAIAFSSGRFAKGFIGSNMAQTADVVTILLFLCLVVEAVFPFKRAQKPRTDGKG